MTVQKATEEIQKIFPDLGYTEIWSQLDSAQKELNDDTKTLWAIGQLSTPSSNTGWSLLSDFLQLEDILLYDSDGEPVYMGDFSYAYEITNSKFYIYSLTSTPITGLDASISTAYISYRKRPTSITSNSSSFLLPEDHHRGILASAYHKLFMLYPVDQIINGTVIKARDYRASQLWEKEYEKQKRAIKRNKYPDNIHAAAQNYQFAGKFELPRRVKDILSASALPPISSLYSKYARWTLTYPTTVTEIAAPSGYSGTVTAAIATNQLTITSTVADFTNVADWNANQEDIQIDSFSSTQWVFNLPTSSWGAIRFEIFE